MFKKILPFLILICTIQTQARENKRLSIKSLIPTKSLSRIEKFSNKSATTTAERAQYIKELYYSVNGYPAGYDTSTSPAPHLDQFNSILGENGVGGVLFKSSYETCESIPTSGSTSGTSPMAGSLTLNFSSPTKSIPSYYITDAGETMDKRIQVTATGSTTITVELKCHDDSTIQTGYVKLEFPLYNVVYEGYFQQNTTTGAINLDMYIKTESGNGNELLIPTQFVTADGENFTIFSAFLSLSGGGGGSNDLVAVTGEANGKAQIAYLNTTDTVGAPLTTSPNSFGSLTTAGGTTVAVECIDISTETVTTGCSNIPAPGSLSIGGATSTWTITSLKSVSL